MADKRKTGSLVFTGARVRFFFDGKLFAYASDVSGSEEILREEINVLGRLAPVEYAETGYRVTFRCRNFRTIPTGSSNPERGNLKNMGVFPKYDDILTSGELTAVITDSITDEVIVHLTQVKAATRSWTVNARSVFAEDITFTAIKDIAGEV